MRRSGKGSGGGIGSKNVVYKPVLTVRHGSKAVSLKYTSQIGASQGNHVNSAEGGGKTLHGVRAKDPYKGPSFHGSGQGNAIAAATVAGPGGSRTVMRSGAQGTHGAVNPGNPRPVEKGGWPDSKR